MRCEFFMGTVFTFPFVSSDRLFGLSLRSSCTPSAVSGGAFAPTSQKQKSEGVIPQCHHSM